MGERFPLRRKTLIQSKKHNHSLAVKLHNNSLTVKLHNNSLCPVRHETTCPVGKGFVNLGYFTCPPVDNTCPWQADNPYCRTLMNYLIDMHESLHMGEIFPLQ